MIRTLVVFLALVAALPATSQVRIRDVFRQMPDTLLPYLTSNNRLDFIDFLDSDMKASVRNNFDGHSEMTRLTDSYLSLRLSEASTVDMRLLTLSKPEHADSVAAQQIVCVVSTYGADVRESTIQFYTADWHPLPTSRFVSQPTDDMLTITLGEEEPTLTLTPECRLDALANEEQQELTKSSKILKWNGEIFNNY